MEVTYEVKREDHWRCTVYSLLHRPESLIVTIIATLFSATIITVFLAPHIPIKGDIGWILTLAIAFCGLAGLAILELWARLRKKIPDPAKPRICLTRVLPEGFCDITPEKEVTLPWSVFREIREARGDLYFWTTQGDGFIIPARAFADRRDALAFRDFARQCQNAPVLPRAQWPLSEGPPDPSVWPPPPQPFHPEP